MVRVYNIVMYELYPYFTNDGTVGLYSRQDDDIYHSTYGALTESWQKFILPARLKQYLASHESVKILDICYGIGYNTKTALNVFVNNILKNEQKIQKNNSPIDCSIASIHTDNIYGELMEEFESQDDSKNKKNTCSKILIDAVDLDKTLIYLSPFIKDASILNFLFNNNCKSAIEKDTDYKQIKKIKSVKKFLKKEFRLSKEVSLILCRKLFESNPEFFNDAILQTILNHKKYKPYLSKFMHNFAKFYQNQGHKHKSDLIKSTFLHNIYYRYLSKSSKNTQNILKNNKIDINLIKNDARYFIQSTNNKYNFIFLDAFTPAKCPTLWTVQFFRKLYSRLEDDGVILTYSNSAAVRNAFLQNGFAVGKIYDSNLKKFIGTIAAKNNVHIEYKLDGRDLDLINSKAGICYEDENLSLSNEEIIERRRLEVIESPLVSSSKVLKEHKNDCKQL